MPDSISTCRIHVRAYECDSLAHVNNAVYIQYLQQATVDALGPSSVDNAFGNVRALAIEYLAPARNRDELEIATWIVNAHDSRVVRGYKITRSADGAPVVNAQIEWDYPASSTFSPLPLLKGAGEGHAPSPLKAFAPPRDNGARHFRWRHTARRYELDATHRVSTASYFNWLEEATFRASNTVGWTLEKMRVENFIVLQHRHDAEFFEPALGGDEIEIVSRLIEVRRVRGTWIHEIFRTRTSTLLVRDYSTGAFLDLNGNIRPALTEMMDALMRGEPRICE